MFYLPTQIKYEKGNEMVFSMKWYFLITYFPNITKHDK